MRPAAAILVLVTMFAAVGAQSPPPVAPVATPPPFDEWMAELRAEAEGRGISPALLDRAFAGIKPVAQVLDRDRTQAEFALDLDAYLKRRLTPATVRQARKMRTQHAALLERVERHYGVPGRIVISVWGLESTFGKFAGVRPTIPALVTLAYDPRRSAMFRNELFNALEIVSRGDIELERLRGSWAGALGQPQFMPSSYLEYAQDFDGDGRKDIWSSLPDVFASIAYYLQRNGWQPGFIWGREVQLSPILLKASAAIPRQEAGCRARRLMTEWRPLSAWREMGLRTRAGSLVPGADIDASLVVAGTRTFLAYGNYDSLLAYNCAHSYALSVALLADQLQ